MPYFIYRIFPFTRLEKVAQFTSFKEASVQAKALRAAPDRPPNCKIKIIFADDELQAEALLSQVREAEKGAIGDD
ncbi:MAG: hypothetical protein ACREUA_02510 [Burkholderiales bacterium]